MLPTYRPGDLVLGWCWFRKLKVGDIVVASVSGRPVIKRVASVQGTNVVLHGDNQAASTDSRSFGPVNRSAIKAKIITWH